MNPVERVIRRADTAQRNHDASAFIVGVAKKYGDDNGGILAASLAHSSFVSLFPLLLVLVTILGLVASSDPGLRHAALGAVAHQVPLIGRQLAANVHELRRSSIIGLVIGLLATIWGSTGLAQTGMFVMESVWNLPGPARPGYFQRLGRALEFLGVLGLGVIVTTLLTTLGAYEQTGPAEIGIEVLVTVTNAAMYLISFRVLTPKGIPCRDLVPGAIAGGVTWTLMQFLGTYLVKHYLSTDSVYGVFAVVLGLAAWLYFAVKVTVYAAEINVVFARRLWPRTIVQPPLSGADQAVMAAQALQNQRRPEQRVMVSFTAHPEDEPSAARIPRTPDEIEPPGTPPARDNDTGDNNTSDDDTSDDDAAEQRTRVATPVTPEIGNGRPGIGRVPERP
ncbi:MAG: YihY/virulence factor BrkB family protein [Streptosporangiaceae bacterium]